LARYSAVPLDVSDLFAGSKDEQELGAACIDLGGGIDLVSIFIRKHMIYADSVRRRRTTHF